MSPWDQLQVVYQCPGVSTERARVGPITYCNVMRSVTNAPRSIDKFSFTITIVAAGPSEEHFAFLILVLILCVQRLKLRGLNSKWILYKPDNYTPPCLNNRSQHRLARHYISKLQKPGFKTLCVQRLKFKKFSKWIKFCICQTIILPHVSTTDLKRFCTGWPGTTSLSCKSLVLKHCVFRGSS